MIIGDRLRALREDKHLSQGDIEKRTGLLRCYISRIENSHTVPSIENLEKIARALELPVFRIFYDGEEPPELLASPKTTSGHETLWGASREEAKLLVKFRRMLARIDKQDRRLLLSMAIWLATHPK
jgi:transcriptional regulator with XRE-family HTH domain